MTNEERIDRARDELFRLILGALVVFIVLLASVCTWAITRKIAMDAAEKLCQ